jgi:hypothetical protein
MGDEHVGDARHTQVGQVVEDGSAAEVDQHRFTAVDEDVDVAGVAEALHFGRDRRESGFSLHV